MFPLVTPGFHTLPLATKPTASKYRAFSLPHLAQGQSWIPRPIQWSLTYDHRIWVNGAFFALFYLDLCSGWERMILKHGFARQSWKLLEIHVESTECVCLHIISLQLFCSRLDVEMMLDTNRLSYMIMRIQYLYYIDSWYEFNPQSTDKTSLHDLSSFLLQL